MRCVDTTLPTREKKVEIRGDEKRCKLKNDPIPNIRQLLGIFQTRTLLSVFVQILEARVRVSADMRETGDEKGGDPI